MTLQIAAEDPRAQAARVAAKAELRGVRTVGLSAQLGDGSTEGPFKVEIEIEPAFAREAERLVYVFDYSVKIAAGDQVSAEIQCGLELEYELPASFDAQDSEFQAYGAVTAFLAAHPYLRETVQSLSSRLGLARVTLEVVRVPLELE